MRACVRGQCVYSVGCLCVCTVHVCICVCVCVCACVCVCMCVCVCVCVCVSGCSHGRRSVSGCNIAYLERSHPTLCVRACVLACVCVLCERSSTSRSKLTPHPLPSVVWLLEASCCCETSERGGCRGVSSGSGSVTSAGDTRESLEWLSELLALRGAACRANVYVCHHTLSAQQA